MPPVFVVLSKLLDLAASPLTWALVLVLLALLWHTRRPGRSRLLLWLAVLELVVFSVEPVPNRLFGWMESRAKQTFRPDEPYDVVVVLGGMVDIGAMRGSGQIELMESADRISQAAVLLRRGQARTVLLSGGLTFPRPGDPSEAAVLSRWLQEQGIAPDRIVVEERSRNTRENALESSRLIAAHGWKRVLLLTSAWHAPRALGCFRAVGLEPDLLAVDHRAREGAGPFVLPRAVYLSASTDALRELLGGAVYRIMGYTR